MMEEMDHAQVSLQKGQAAHQWTKARLAYIRSNLWSSLENTSAMAVELEIMHTARCTLARSPPGTTVGGW